MDGIKEHEIHQMTGLPDEDCKKIWLIYVATLRNPNNVLPKHVKPLLAAILLNCNSIMASHHVSALQEIMGNLTKNDLIKIVRGDHD